MDKREISARTLIMIIIYGMFAPPSGFTAEDLKKPLLELPQVNIVGKKSFEQIFVEKDFRPDEFGLEKDATEDIEEDSSGFLSIGYGRFNSKIGEIAQSARTQSLYYSAKVSVNDVDAEILNSQFTTYQPSFKLGVLLNEENEFVFKMQYFDKIMGLPGKIDAPTPNSKRRNSDFEVSTQLIYSRDDYYQISLEPYYGTSTLNEDITRRDFKNERVGGRIEIDSDEHDFNIDIYQNRLISHYEQAAFDAKLRIAPLYFGDKWQLNLGANVFGQERFGQRPAPFVELIFTESEDYSHKLKITREFEPLIFSQRYLDVNYVEVDPTELRPRRETNISYKIDKYVSPEWRTSVVFYVRQDKDMWFWNDPDEDGLYSPTLIEKVNFGGVKLSTEYSWSEAFSHFISLNLRRVRSKDVNYEFVPYEPKQRLSVGLTYKMDEKFKLDIVGDYFGRRFYQGNSKESFSGYFLLGGKLTYAVKDYLTLFVLVDNLLNDHYEIVKGYPSQSRSAVTGIKLKF